MAEVKAETIENAETHMGERMLGRTCVLGEAEFDLRPLSNEDDMYVGASIAECDDEIRTAAVVEMTCRLGIEGWRLKRANGENVAFEQKALRHGGALAITRDCIRQLDWDIQYYLFGEIQELSKLSKAEETRLDFTIPPRGAAIQS